MPSTATITTYYSFTANTKARAAQVNNNFDVYRGHIIPVEVLTATSSNNNYDLGSSDYFWRNLYVNHIYKNTNVTTAASAAGQYAVSAHFTASFNTTTATNITGSTVTVVTTGKPVKVGLIPHNGQTATDSQIVGSSTDKLYIMRGATTVTTARVGATNLWPTIIWTYDFPAAGTYNYYLAGSQGATTSGGTISNCRMYAHEVTN